MCRVHVCITERAWHEVTVARCMQGHLQKAEEESRSQLRQWQERLLKQEATARVWQTAVQAACVQVALAEGTLASAPPHLVSTGDQPHAGGDRDAGKVWFCPFDFDGTAVAAVMLRQVRRAWVVLVAWVPTCCATVAHCVCHQLTCNHRGEQSRMCKQQQHDAWLQGLQRSLRWTCRQRGTAQCCERRRSCKHNNSGCTTSRSALLAAALRCATTDRQRCRAVMVAVGQRAVIDLQDT
jgi:hypothetical protein